MIDKDSSVEELLRMFRLEFGEDVIFAADYWPADRYAIGFFNRGYPGKLIYVCTFGKEPGRCDCELELIFNDLKPGYSESGGWFDNINSEELKKVARRYWAEPIGVRPDWH